MSNVQSYNALIDRFKAFASGHFILKSFSHGQIDTADLEKFTEYPFMHVVPSNVTYAKGTKTFSFQIVLADLPRDKDDKVEFQREVLSDLQRIAEDLVAEITNHRVLFGDLITVQNVSLEPFLEEFHNTLTGWTVSLDLLVPYYWDACSIPAEWNDFFESGSGGTGSILTFIDSITRDENGNVSLVNDEATPAPNYYYGTNDEGVRGWYLLTDEVGLTCATIGTCQTIIDIESAIDDLQTEIALKANTADLGAVAFSNDYNDLDNLPNLSGYGDMFKSVYDTDVDGVVDSAERIQIVVRNSTGSTLTKGQIVYLSGATGNRPNAVLAQANTEATSSKTIGMVIADIANNADGQVAVNGTLHDLDTSAFTAGDTLWLSATTAGGMVANTPPSEPNHTVFIGYVARSHPNLGRIVLAIQNGYELDELHGVQITTPANNEVLTYESSTSLWKNKTIQNVLGYTPFNLPSLTSGSVLFSNGTTIAQDNANLFWDDTNNRLGIGTASPDRPLHINSAGTTGLRIDVTGGGSNAIFLGAASSLIRWSNGSYFSNTGMYSVGNDQQYITFDGTNTQVRLQIKASNGNIGIGTTTDAGFKLDVNGSVRTTGSISAASAVARGTYLNQTLVATANNDVLVGLDIQDTFTLGAFTGVTRFPLRIRNSANDGSVFGVTNDGIVRWGSKIESGNNTGQLSWDIDLVFINAALNLGFRTGGVDRMRIFSTGNLLLQSGGTFTDAGYRLDVNGTTMLRGIVYGVGSGGGAIQLLTTAGTGTAVIGGNTGTPLRLQGQNLQLLVGSTQVGQFFDTTGNLRLQSGGTFTDSGYRLDVQGTSRFSGAAVFGSAITVGGAVAINNSLAVGTNQPAVASAQLEVVSTTRGFLPPRMTNAQKLAIASPAAGLVVYDTTLNKLCVRTASAWETITSL